MGVALYMDVHVPGPITQQLRRRGADVLTARWRKLRELGHFPPTLAQNEHIDRIIAGEV